MISTFSVYMLLSLIYTISSLPFLSTLSNAQERFCFSVIVYFYAIRSNKKMPFLSKRAVMNEGETLRLVREKATSLCFNLSSLGSVWTKGVTAGPKKNLKSSKKINKTGRFDTISTLWNTISKKDFLVLNWNFFWLRVVFLKTFVKWLIINFSTFVIEKLVKMSLKFF